jgi:hypothetical protein
MTFFVNRIAWNLQDLEIFYTKKQQLFNFFKAELMSPVFNDDGQWSQGLISAVS